MEWFEDLYNRPIYFDLYAEDDTRLALKEVDGIIQLLDLKPDQSLLDVCCGYGRHAVELAKRGYQVTGIDLSPKQIEQAQRRAAEAGVSAQFISGDARTMEFPSRFDVLLNLFLAFGYFQDEKENLRMLERMADATRPGGILLMDLWNREKEIRAFAPRMREHHGDIVIDKQWEFDAWNGRLNWTNTVTFPDGRIESWDHSIRAYTLIELRNMFHAVGFEVEKVFGDFAGNPYTLDSSNMILLARKRYGLGLSI
jgi:SAM-dependent methyltransferase